MIFPLIPRHSPFSFFPHLQFSQLKDSHKQVLTLLLRSYNHFTLLSESAAMKATFSAVAAFAAVAAAAPRLSK